MITQNLGEQVENVMDAASNDDYYIDWLKWARLENEHNILIICNSHMHANIVLGSNKSPIWNRKLQNDGNKSMVRLKLTQF